MFISTPQALAFMAALQTTLATTVPKYCGKSITAEYNDIEGAEIVSKPLPTPYYGLNYTGGWAAVANAKAASVQGSVVRVHTPPGSIFFGEVLGQTSTKNIFSVAPDGHHLTLTSLYLSCLTAPVGTVGLGGAAGGANVPLPCTVRVTGTKSTGQTVNKDLVFGGKALEQQKYTFTDFVDLVSVNTVLVTSDILDGIKDVNVDSLEYTLWSKC